MRWKKVGNKLVPMVLGTGKERRKKVKRILEFLYFFLC